MADGRQILFVVTSHVVLGLLIRDKDVESKVSSPLSTKPSTAITKGRKDHKRMRRITSKAASGASRATWTVYIRLRLTREEGKRADIVAGVGDSE